MLPVKVLTTEPRCLESKRDTSMLSSTITRTPGEKGSAVS
jgi:hypothetical protein